MVFRPELSWEFKSKDEIEHYTIRAMRNHVSYLQKVSPYYHKLLQDLNPAGITSLTDIASLPLTDRYTLSQNLMSFQAINPEKIVETVVTSGSTGRPLLFVMSADDIDRLTYSQALSLHCAGITNGDRAQILVSLDYLSFFGMALYHGLIAIGANANRIGIPNLNTQQIYFKWLKPTVIIGVPSFLKKLGLKLAQDGFDIRSTTIEKIFCIGESMRDEKLTMNNLGKSIQDLFNAKVFSLYGATEISVFYGECIKRNGCHSQPELVYTEIVDEKGIPVSDGTPGELVATPFGVDGMPLLRYRTGDITFKIPGSCQCGRNSDRIGPILARRSQIIRYKGQTLYPRLITNALDELDFIEDYIVMLEGKEFPSAQISLHIVSHPSKVETINSYIRKNAKVTIPILISNVTTINSIRGNSGKKIRVIDKREKL